MGQTCSMVSRMPLIPRPSLFTKIYVQGKPEALQHVIDYLSEPLISGQILLPGFYREVDKGEDALVIDYEKYTMYKTTEGLLVGAWKTYRISDGNSDLWHLTAELTMEGRRNFIKEYGPNAVLSCDM